MGWRLKYYSHMFDRMMDWPANFMDGFGASPGYVDPLVDKIGDYVLRKIKKNSDFQEFDNSVTIDFKVDKLTKEYRPSQLLNWLDTLITRGKTKYRKKLFKAEDIIQTEYNKYMAANQ